MNSGPGEAESIDDGDRVEVHQLEIPIFPSRPSQRHLQQPRQLLTVEQQ